MRVPLEPLQQEARRVLTTAGLSDDDADTVARVLVEAEADGLSGHGLTRLPIYKRQLTQGGLNPAPEMTVTMAAPGLVRLEADRAPGPVAGIRAGAEAQRRAPEQGAVGVAVAGAGHVGPLSAYVERLAQAGLVGIALANTPSAMAPWGGHRAVLGTNPIAFACPLDVRDPSAESPIVVDLSLSVAARGKILQAQSAGESIPEEWAVDAEGTPTTDPTEALAGSLLPMGEAKGYALALMVEVLAGAMAGRTLATELPLPWDDPDTPSTPGLFLQAMAPEAFDEPAALSDRFHALARAVQEAGGRLPGASRHRKRREARTEGIPISEPLRAELEEAGMRMADIAEAPNATAQSAQKEDSAP